MPFRADEAAERGFERAKRYLIPHDWPTKERNESLDCLRKLTEEYGPVVSRYPTWHPFVKNHKVRCPEFWPSDRTGFDGLDHTVGFVKAFITCPYTASGNPKRIYESIRNFQQHHAGYVSVEDLPLEASFYSVDATTILVTCDWSAPRSIDCQIPKSIAVPLMIENVMRNWLGARQHEKLAERWDTMKPYLLGEPCGARSSLFVSQETSLAIKKAYIGLVESGMFGPLRMD